MIYSTGTLTLTLDGPTLTVVLPTGPTLTIVLPTGKSVWNQLLELLLNDDELLELRLLTLLDEELTLDELETDDELLLEETDDELLLEETDDELDEDRNELLLVDDDDEL